MNLWLSTHFLLAALFLSSSALTEECQPLVTPLSLANSSVIHGTWTFLVGYNDNEAYNDVLKKTQSSRITITASPYRPNDVVMSQENKINGTCLSSSMNITVDGDTGLILYPSINSAFHILPTCEGCLILSINATARNQDKILQQMKFDSDITGEELSARAVYLLGRNSTLKDPDLEHFKQQASCLGFSKDPGFRYDPENEFCAEGEGIKITL